MHKMHKTVLLLLTSLVAYSIQAMDPKPTTSTKKIKIIKSKKFEKIVEFDPQYQGIFSTYQQQNCQTALIFSQGILDKGHDFFPDISSANIKKIYFNYSDLGKTLLGSNFGGTNDTLVLIYAVIRAAKQQCNIILFGYSRGTAPIIRLLHALHNPGNYKKLWDTFGMTKENISTIKQRIEKVFLANPLLDTKEAIKRHIRKSKKSTTQQPQTKSIKTTISDWWNSITCTSCAQVATKTIDSSLNRFGAYEKDLPQPIKLLKELKNADYKIDITFAENDKQVSNVYDDELKQLGKKNNNWEVSTKHKEHKDISSAEKKLKKYMRKKIPFQKNRFGSVKGLQQFSSEVL